MAMDIKTDSIRRHFDENTSKWYFSVADAVGIIAPTGNPRNYWKVLKSRLKKTRSELVTGCYQLKIKAKDGKSYLTDVGDQETILKIVGIISKKDLPRFQEFFDNLAPKTSTPAPTKKKSYPHLSAQAGENFVLPIDGYITRNALMIKAFTAGANREDIIISATTTTLTIKGVREITKDNSVNYLKQEILWGEFERIIQLPTEIDVEKIEASEQGGSLIIRLPLI